jgi:hypothetical protein
MFGINGVPEHKKRTLMHVIIGTAKMSIAPTRLHRARTHPCLELHTCPSQLKAIQSPSVPAELAFLHCCSLSSLPHPCRIRCSCNVLLTQPNPCRIYMWLRSGTVSNLTSLEITATFSDSIGREMSLQHYSLLAFGSAPRQT